MEGIRKKHLARVVLTSGLLLFLAAFGDGESLAQSAKQNIEDQILATRVRLALANDTELRPFNFSVEAEGTTVTLTGRVRTDDQNARAVAIVQRLSGVSAVQSGLRLLDGTAPEYGYQNGEYALDAAEVDSLDPMTMLELELEEESEEDLISDNFDDTPTGEPQIIYRVPEGYHLVEEGDTLLRISERYGVSIRDLRALNDLSIAARPEVGELLRIKVPD